MPTEINGAAEEVVGPIRNALKAAAKEQTNTFTARQVFSAGIAHAELTLVDGAAIEWDTAAGDFAAVTINGARTLEMLNLLPGIYRLRVTQGAGGGHTLAFDAGHTVRAPGGVLARSAAAGAVDGLTIRHVSGSVLDVTVEADFQEL
jgi:hypothetical protein